MWRSGWTAWSSSTSKAVDILASKEGRRIAFEVETRKSDALANVMKLDGTGVQRVIVAARDLLKEQLRDQPHVEVMGASEAMNPGRVGKGGTGQPQSDCRAAILYRWSCRSCARLVQRGTRLLTRYLLLTLHTDSAR